MAEIYQNLLNAWSIDIYMGWSIMDVFWLLILLFIMAGVIGYMLDKAPS